MKTFVFCLALALQGAGGEAQSPQKPAPPQGGEPPAASQPEIVQDGAWQRLAPVPCERALREAIQWLVKNQNTDGSWGSHHSPRPIEVLASIPGSQQAFRVATTALCVMALTDARLDVPGAADAAERGLEYLLKDFDVKRQSGLEHYNVWSMGYALECFGEQLKRRPEDPRAKSMRAACDTLVERLGQYQTLDGGWGYLSIDGVPTYQPSDTSMSFTTATILLGLHVAGQQGIAIPKKLLERAVDHIERSRLSDDAFLYGEYLKYRPRMGINELYGSACRTPLCLRALDLFGRKIETQHYVSALENLLVKSPDYQKASVRRPIPHESWYSISGYFYLYGHAYAAYVLERLPKKEQDRFWPLLVDAVQYCRDPDGSFWDYPLYSYHKPYGTALAVLALARAQRAGAK
ncbi:MAG: terpene cyclase/mutase family protein [Planctomycetes bacterium]|nr:terpene cyclase/mutase family protein [Planctomycetota bacterium]